MIFKNKRGAATDLIVLIILSLVIVVVFGLFIYLSHTINSSLSSIGQIGSANATAIASQTFGQVDGAIGSLRFLSIVIIFSLVISMFITNYLIKNVDPAFFAMYVCLVVLAVIFSAYVSNSYETILTLNPLGPQLQTFTGANYFFAHLPYFTTIIGFVGAVILFIGIIRGREQGGSFI